MKILLFQIRYLCHKSNELFVDNLAEEFEKLGHEVTKCNIIDSKDMESVLNALVGLHFDAMIDFNSVLPSTEMEEGGYFLDKIDAPFYNFIVDHPLFHHAHLKVPLKNYNVICIDNNHYSYLKKYYPHIKNVLVHPLPPTKGMIDCAYKDRAIDVLYPVSYMPFKEAEKMLLSGKIFGNHDILNEKEMDWAKSLVDIMMDNPLLPIESAFEKVLEDDGFYMEGEEFRNTLFRLHLSDIYVRCYFREKMLDILLKEGLKVTLCGKDWDLYYAPKGAKYEVYPDVSYTTAMQYMQNSKALVNVTPGFKAGLHDRASSGIINSCLVLSDESINKSKSAAYDFEKLRIDNPAVLWYKYDTDDMQRAATLLKQRLSNENSYYDYLAANKEYMEQNLSWEILAISLAQSF
ncbi:MAG: hypothetical protein K6B15_08910 [Parasporobacterium sp.]|nr:hypothetical protein [Parasporobacterium sp.]